MADKQDYWNKTARAFNEFDHDDWEAYYYALNKELSVEKCGLELNEIQKECYQQALEKLKAERKEHPNIPIMYEMRYRDYE